MRLSCLWLNDWIDHGLSPEILAEKLTSLGLESRIAEDRRGAYENVVIGKVGTVVPHPGADNLRLTKVSDGTQTHDIVCGAPNVAEGQTVAVALIGATLPNGMKIEKRKIRGVESNGMICSEAELGLGEGSAGIMVLDDSFKAGAKLSDCLEIEDVLLEVDLTPNRGDCLSVLGIAREVSAITGAKIKLPALPQPPIGISGLTVQTEPAGCHRYTAHEITGVKTAPSPFKIRRRLQACGIRPINNIVDATNYVMLETGNPLHAFDKRMITGGTISVRQSRNGEPFTTLDGKDYTLEEGMLLIADSRKGLALAGIMGGLDSGIKTDTTDIILEAAYFDPVRIRRTAKKLLIGTESSYRFERGVDPEGVKLASLLAAKMMCEYGGGKAGGFIDARPQQPAAKQITLDPKRAGDIIGAPVTADEAAEQLGKLGFHCQKSGGFVTTSSPSHRHDIHAEIDLIEELSRLRGFDRINATIPRLPQHQSEKTGRYAKRREVNRLLAGAGFRETINYSFINPAWRKSLGLDKVSAAPMENRINAELGELRTSLLPGLLKTVSFNLRQGEEKFAVFETGSVFTLSGKEVNEETKTAGIMTIGDDGTLKRDFHRLKGILQKVLRACTGLPPEFKRPVSPYPFLYDHRQAEILLNGKSIGYMGQLHTLAADDFDINAGMVCFEISLDGVLGSSVKGGKFKAIPRFPGIKRDIAIVVDEKAEVGGIVETIMSTDPGRISRCGLFDLYQGPQVPAGKKSLAFDLLFIDPEKTMTDKAGDEMMAKILETVGKKHGAVLRG